MRFQNMTIHPFITDAVKVAEYIIEGKVLYQKLKEKHYSREWFKYDTGTFTDVVTKLKSNHSPISILTYDPGYKSKSIGYYQDSEIYLNVRTIHSLKSFEIVGFLLHERAHFLGFHHVDKGWWGKIRANYKTANKCKYSLPYWLSENVRELV